MELQELVVRAAVSQMRFRLAPRFPDVRGALVERLQAEFSLSEYGWGDSRLQVWNTEKTRTLGIGSRDATFSFEPVQRVDEYIDDGRRFFALALQELAVREIEFLGVRTYWMAAVDSFAQLVDWVRTRVSPHDPLSVVPGQASDLSWIVEFQKDDPKYRVAVAPMLIEQFISQLVNTDESELFPAEFLFVDIDRFYNDTKITADEAIDKWEDSVRKSLELGTRIGSELVGDSGIQSR